MISEVDIADWEDFTKDTRRRADNHDGYVVQLLTVKQGWIDCSPAYTHRVTAQQAMDVWRMVFHEYREFRVYEKLRRK